MGLTNSQYDALMRIYSLRQNENAADLERRRREAYQKIPQLKELDGILSGAGAALARIAAQSGQVDKEAFLKKSAELSALRTQLLRDHGFAPDHLQMRYTCPDCQDTGYVGSAPCHCFRQEAAFLLYAQSNLKELQAEDGFSSFSLSWYPEDLTDPTTHQSARVVMTHVLQECTRFVEAFDTEGGNLFFYGGTGLGKTFLSRCIAGELIRSGHSVLYYGAHDLFEALAASAFHKEETEAVDLGYISGCDLLIIDDLGTELTNAFVNSRLFLVLNERIGKGKSTIISTNLTLPGFHDTYSERTFSRITSNFRLLHFIGNDIRLQQKLAGGTAYAASSRT